MASTSFTVSTTWSIRSIMESGSDVSQPQIRRPLPPILPARVIEVLVNEAHHLPHALAEFLGGGPPDEVPAVEDAMDGEVGEQGEGEGHRQRPVLLVGGFADAQLVGQGCNVARKISRIFRFEIFASPTCAERTIRAFAKIASILGKSFSCRGRSSSSRLIPEDAGLPVHQNTT